MTEGIVLPGGEKADEPPAKKKVQTAFTIYLDAGGHWTADLDVSAHPPKFDVERPMTATELVPACAQVTADAQMITIVQSVVNAQMQVGRQLAQAEQQAQMAARLGLGRHG